VERELKGIEWKGINGRKLWRRPRPKLGCRAKERERERDCIFIYLSTFINKAPPHEG
jgi:hypothetical protein